MTKIYESWLLDDDDVFAKTTSLFQKYDGSSSVSSCSRSSKGSAAGSWLRTPNSNNESCRKTVDSRAMRPPTGLSRHHKNRVTRDFSSSSFENSPTEINDENSCELCGSTTDNYNYHPCKRNSLQTNSSFSSQDNISTRYISYCGSPSYERGSWRRRFRAERNTEIDLTPLLDVLKKIDNINTSMGISQEEYTKNLPKQTTGDENDNTAYLTNDRNAFRDTISKTKNVSRVLRSVSKNTDKNIKDVHHGSHNTCTNIKELTTSENKQCCPEADSCEDNYNLVNLHTNPNIDDNNNKEKNDSESEFEKIYDDAINYNIQTDKNRKLESGYKKQDLDKLKNQRFKTKTYDISNKQKEINLRHVPSVDNYWSSESESPDRPLEIKTSRKRRKSKGYLNRSFLATRSRKDSNEKDKVKLTSNANKANNYQYAECISPRHNDNRKSTIRKLAQNNADTYTTQSKERSSDKDDIMSTNRVVKTESDTKLPRSGETSNVELKGKSNNRSIDTDIQLIDRARAAVSDNKPYTIDKIPGTYEEFSLSLEEASLNGAMKRSSIEKRPNTVKVFVTDVVEENQTQKKKERRRSSVSQLTAFWESKLSSTCQQDTTDNHQSDTDDNDNNDNDQEIPEFDFPKRLKKTLQGNVLLQENAASTETGTDEDEKFRRIQSKLENMCKQSSRLNIRRKSILKNKGETSSFLNEFLTVPAARTRNSDSESGSNSQQSIKPEHLAKRRVSFQYSVTQDSSSSSETDSQDEESGDTSKNKKGHVSEDNTTFKDYSCKSGIENAENEHIVWREEDTTKNDKNPTEIICNQIDNSGNHLDEIELSENSRSNDTIQNRKNTKLTESSEVTKSNKTYSCTDQTGRKGLTSPNDTNVTIDMKKEQANTSYQIIKEKMELISKVSDTPNDTNNPYVNGLDKRKQLASGKSLWKPDNLQSETLNDAFDKAAKSCEVGKVKRKPRAKLFSVAGEDDDGEQASLLDNRVELDSSDSTDVELSWRTRGYSADFYLSRKSTTGSEIIDKFRQVLRKRSKDNTPTKKRRTLKEESF